MVTARQMLETLRSSPNVTLALAGLGARLRKDKDTFYGACVAFPSVYVARDIRERIEEEHRCSPSGAIGHGAFVDETLLRDIMRCARPITREEYDAVEVPPVTRLRNTLAVYVGTDLCIDEMGRHQVRTVQ